MSSFSRIKNIFVGLMMIACALLMILIPEDGYIFAIIIIGISMVARGIKNIWFYFSMARHMVGGMTIFYKGVIFLDLGFFALSVTQLPSQIYVMIYLIGIHLFNGVISIMRTAEAKKHGSKVWKGKLIHGVIDIAMAVLCICFIKNMNVAVLIYALGLIYSAVLRIIGSFRRTAIVYIQ